MILIGEKDSRRTEYFLNAAKEVDLKIVFVEWPSIDEWRSFDLSSFEGEFIKIDPPPMGNISVEEIDTWANEYVAFLNRFKDYNMKMLNNVDSLINVLDKLRCKQILQAAGIAVTSLIEMSDRRVSCLNELKSLMLEKKIYSIFIKSRYGSGASGILAYKINPKNFAEFLYTSSIMKNGCIYNTKKLRKLTEKSEIELIANALLQKECAIEEWMPKAKNNGKFYDLRVVFQFGAVEHIVVRQSEGCITNLHLNNDALPINELQLDKQVLNNIEALCKNALALFPGLNIAGVDILLEKDTLNPYIIEINGQGDLIYNDIFQENRIYKAQIEYVKSCNSQNMGVNYLS